MRQLIINLPRTGSTSLFNNLVKEHKAFGCFNPFDGTGRTRIFWEKENLVVKSGIPYPEGLNVNEKIEFYSDLIPRFDKVILLSRKGIKDHIESYAYFLLNNNKENFVDNTKNGDKTKFNSQSKYTIKPSELTLESKLEAENHIKIWNNVINILSSKYNIPISYYEDLFDPNSKDRYRQPYYNENLI